jgi:hypothetical protein
MQMEMYRRVVVMSSNENLLLSILSLILSKQYPWKAVRS